jgi:hypothetical protein
MKIPCQHFEIPITEDLVVTNNLLFQLRWTDKPESFSRVTRIFTFAKFLRTRPTKKNDRSPDIEIGIRKSNGQVPALGSFGLDSILPVSTRSSSKLKGADNRRLVPSDHLATLLVRRLCRLGIGAVEKMRLTDISGNVPRPHQICNRTILIAFVESRRYNHAGADDGTFEKNFRCRFLA